MKAEELAQIHSQNRMRNTELWQAAKDAVRDVPDEDAVPFAIAGALECLAGQLRAKGERLVAEKRRGSQGINEKLIYAATELAGAAESLRRHGINRPEPLPEFAPAVVDASAELAAFLDGRTNTLPPLDALDAPVSPLATLVRCAAREQISGDECGREVHTADQSAHEGAGGVRWPWQPGDETLTRLVPASTGHLLLDTANGAAQASAEKKATAVALLDRPEEVISADAAELLALFADAPAAVEREPDWKMPADPRPYVLLTSDRPVPDHVSVSQITTLEACGLQGRLKYRDEAVTTQPALWNVAGTAFHYAAEAVEKAAEHYAVTIDEATAIWRGAWDRSVAETQAQTDVPFERWRVAKKGKEDAAWWGVEGPRMVHAYAQWSAKRHADGWTLTGMEVPFSTDFGVLSQPLIGFIDELWMRKTMEGIELEITDLKSGAKPPESTFQLGGYGHALAVTNPLVGIPGVKLTAAYYSARAGELGEVIDPLAAHELHEVLYRASTTIGMHAANVYPANPNPAFGGPCGICDVRHHCPIMALKG